ncbi:acyl-CoA carboxylase subunit epsilon [Salinibacterium sp.]|uniref:acyl-CoA carboxylase subunit epsilon n=1 Tax=Salinibacterium sp. TaxID=1915057 RepID=UPI00286CEA8E|nr:acyl-CoA carboxylase subunit epsilon [Salinibacterium sp.]
MTASADSGAPATLRIVSPGATEEDVAAVTAVLHRALDELAGGMAVEGEVRVSAWQRSQRSVRTPLTPGAGSWRDFSG